MNDTDTEHKVFRTFNIVDLTIFIFVLFLFIGLLIRIFFPWFYRSILTQEAEWKWMRVEVITDNVLLMKIANAGDFQIGLRGQKEAIIEKLELIKKQELFDEVLKKKFSDEYLVKITFRVYARLWRNDPPSFGGIVLKKMAYFAFNHKDYWIDGTILDVEKINQLD